MLLPVAFLILPTALAGVVDYEARIINGEDAVANRNPYTVSIESDGFDDDFFYGDDHNCGGTLIAPDLVLSAAHCFEPGYSYSVATNPYSLSDPLESSERFSVIQYEMHPFYGSINSFDHDFAVIKLSGSSNLPHIRINSDGDLPAVGAPLQLMGWGYSSLDDWVSHDVLQQLNATALSNEECIERMTAQSGDDAPPITPDVICTLSADDTGGCFGDSGGPLVILGEEASADVQVGIVSFGYDCDNLAGFARVSEEYNWIRYQVCRLSDNPPASFNCDAEGGVTFSPAPSSAPTAPTTSPSPTGEDTNVLLVLDTDSFPCETSWAIEDEDGVEVASIRPGDYHDDVNIYTHLFSLERGSEFTFILQDTYGDSFHGTAALYLGDEADDDKILAYFDGAYYAGSLFSYSYEMTFTTDESGIRTAFYPTQTPSAPSATPSGIPSAPSASAAPSSPQRSVYVEVYTDNFPYETGWLISELDATIVFEVPYDTYQTSYSTYGEVLSLQDSQEYELTLSDSYCDGFSGSLAVYLGEEAAVDRVIAYYSRFEGFGDYFSCSRTFNFVVSDSDTIAVFPTAAPTTPAPTLIRGPFPACSVCGESSSVTEPDAIFDFSSEMSIRCGMLENNGQEGLISADYCGSLPSLLENICGCT